MTIVATVPVTAAPLTGFEALDREACLTRWRKQFGHEPPGYVSVEFMRRVLSFEAQVKIYGGHSRAVRHVIRSILKEAETGKPKAASKPVPSPVTLRPGTYLLRECNGRPYRVEVTENGFVMDGKAYASLSAIAHKITGTIWSGPRFFGLART